MECARNEEADVFFFSSCRFLSSSCFFLSLSSSSLLFLSSSSRFFRMVGVSVVVTAAGSLSVSGGFVFFRFSSAMARLSSSFRFSSVFCLSSSLSEASSLSPSIDSGLSASSCSSSSSSSTCAPLSFRFISSSTASFHSSLPSRSNTRTCFSTNFRRSRRLTPQSRIIRS